MGDLKVGIHKFKGVMLIMTALFLVGCGDSEAEELEKQRQIELEANERAVEMVEDYKEEVEKKRVSPYTISEMEEGFGAIYKDVRSRISDFNNDLLSLRDGDITVYDINKKISDYRLELNKYDEVDTLKIPEDYISFYYDFEEIALEYVDSLETFGNYYQSQDTAGVEDTTMLISNNLTKLYNIEFSIFGTPLGDEILTGNAKDRSDKRLKELCRESVAEDNKEYLESIALEEVNKREMNDDELLLRRQEEEEYAKLMEEYREEVSVDEEKCYENVMEERSTFGSRVVESDNADLERELMEILDQRTEDVEDGEVEEGGVDGEETVTEDIDSFEDSEFDEDAFLEDIESGNEEMEDEADDTVD